MNSVPPDIILVRDLQRERLTNQVLDATTLEEISAARLALRSWIEVHTEEEGMSDAFEQLSLLEDIALEQAKSPVNRALWFGAHQSAESHSQE